MFVEEVWTLPVYIQWKEDYSVGHDEIDKQHQQLIGIINDLFLAIKDGSEEKFLQEILVRMYEYTKLHFVYEEELLARISYPNIENHQSLHEWMVVKTKNMRHRLLDHEETAREILEMLKKWWIDHIRKTDMQYRPYLEGSAD